MTTYEAIKGVRRYTEDLTWDETYGSYAAAFPASNLTSLPLSYVCRSSGLGATQARWKGKASQSRPIRMVGLCRHNISLDGQSRIRLYSNAGITCTVNTGTDVVTATAHAMSTGEKAVIWSTGTLPTGIVDGTIYFIRRLSSATFTLHPTLADAQADTNKVDISSSGSGTHEVLGGLIYDSSWFDVWPIVYSADMLEWEDDQWWSGRYSTEEIAGRNWTRPFLLDIIYLFRTITIEVLDSTNSAGNVEIGLVEVARGWVFGYNFAPGSQFGFRFRTKAIEHWGGGVEHERLEKPRVFKGSISMLPLDEIWGSAFEDLSQNDLDVPYLWVPHPDREIHWLRNAMLVRNTDPGMFGYLGNPDVGTAPLAMEEVL